MDLIFDVYPNETHLFDYDTYFKSEMKCELVVTNCVTGKAEYLDEREDKTRLMKICRASCSMPLLTPVVRLEGTPYLDGGLADSVPLDRAKTYGNSKIVVILTRNQGYRKEGVSKGMAKLYRKAYRSYPNLVRAVLLRNLYYNRTMEQIEQLEQEGKIFVLRPQIKPVSRLERNTDTLMEFYNHGHELMEQEYARLMEYLKA